MLIGIDASRATSSSRTGTEEYSYHLLSHLVPLIQRRGHKLRLYFDSTPSSEVLDGILGQSNPDLRFMSFPRLWTHLRLGLELRTSPPDLFFTPAHVIPFGYYGVSVATVHDLGYKHVPQAHPWHQRRYLDWSTRHNCQSAISLVADSQSTADDIHEFYGTPIEKINTVYPGLNPSTMDSLTVAERQSILEKYGLSEPYFLFIGTLHPRKNISRLLIAFAQSKLSHHSLVLAGKTGWLKGEMRKTVDSLPSEVRERVKFTGYVDESDKTALMAAAQALILPSLYEGFGFPVIEAQAAGIPVICSNSSSLPEIAGKGALLVDPLDESALTVAMERLAADKKLRDSLISAGLENSRRFNWSDTARQILDVLEAAVGEASPVATQ